jgi:L-proline---[L-prolyl-carrier protein] ligase
MFEECLISTPEESTVKIHELFLQAAARWPDADAFVFEDSTLSYRASALRVEQIARILATSLPVGSRVALNMHKSVDAIVMMLACLRAGLTYVPIDPMSPLSRRLFILRDSAASALVVDQRTANDWQVEKEALQSVQVIATSPAATTGSDTETTLEHLLDMPVPDSTLPEITDDALAYILYTSGSTGDPKGSLITHANAAAFVSWALDYFDIHPGDRVAVHAPLHFDLPVLDIYVGLASGATVCPVDGRTLLFPEALLRFLRKQCITVLYAVPSALLALVNRSTLLQQGLPALRLLLYAGEEFHPTPLSKLMDALPNTRVFNLYGPIETNVITAIEVIPAFLAYTHIPIGYPLANTHICLIDANGHAIETLGDEGEIAVAGPSVSPGYLNQPELTAKTRISVTDSYGKWTCYRTGDFARWGEGGLLHFLGRRDALIKTRGFRVDLGDVEAALTSHPALAEVSVVATPHPDYTNLLGAFIVLKQNADVSEGDLFAWCRDRLPAYMVPQQVIFCAELPKTSTGKVARRQLAMQFAGPAHVQ